MLGLLQPWVYSRFLYYVSDLPLSVGTTLARKLSAWEGIPPLYAITRALVDKVLEPIDRTHVGSAPLTSPTPLAGTAMFRSPVPVPLGGVDPSPKLHRWDSLRRSVNSQTFRRGTSKPVSLWCPLRRAESQAPPEGPAAMAVSASSSFVPISVEPSRSLKRAKVAQDL